MKGALIISAALLFCSGFAQAWTESEELRWHKLNQELRCLVCQNQSIADSHAELAADLRGQTRQMIEAGKSDDEIRSYMTERYGDFVLYRPPFKPLTALLWLGPFLMLGLAVAFVWRLRRHSLGAPQTHAQDLQSRLNDINDD